MMPGDIVFAKVVNVWQMAKVEAAKVGMRPLPPLLP
jgi:hypothetical protein